MYILPLILYRLAILPLPRARRLVLQRSPIRLFSGGGKSMVRRQVCIQRTRNRGLSMPDLVKHCLSERLVYLDRSLSGDAVWRRKVSRTFPRFKSDPKAEGRRKPRDEAPFVHKCRTVLRNPFGSNDFSRPRKELYRDLVVLFTQPLRSSRI